MSDIREKIRRPFAPIQREIMKETKIARDEALEIERFFRSGWYSQLTSVDGDYLIKRLQDEVRQSESIRGRKIYPIGGSL